MVSNFRGRRPVATRNGSGGDPFARTARRSILGVALGERAYPGAE